MRNSPKHIMNIRFVTYWQTRKYSKNINYLRKAHKIRYHFRKTLNITHVYLINTGSKYLYQILFQNTKFLLDNSKSHSNLQYKVRSNFEDC